VFLLGLCFRFGLLFKLYEVPDRPQHTSNFWTVGQGILLADPTQTQGPQGAFVLRLGSDG